MKRVLILLSLAAVAAPLVAQARTEGQARPEGAARADAQEQRRTSICHRVSSRTRPYRKLSLTARQLRAHARHAADIIPAARGACPRSILSATSGGIAMSVTLVGETETPAGDPVGTGSATIRMRLNQGQVCFRLSVQNLGQEPAAAHIHRGATGESGPVVIPLRIGSGCVAASRALVREILRNRDSFYVNVHTAEFPGGAVRGQLAGTTPAAAGRTFSVALTGAQECTNQGTCGVGDPDGAGTATFRFRPDNQVCYRFRVQNIQLPSVGAHIHRAPRGQNGPIVVPFDAPNASGVSAGCVAGNPAVVQEILANPANFYANVHTRDFPAGAVRGQLA